MTVSRRMGIFLFVVIIGVMGFDFGERYSISGVPGLIAPAEARVGRPLSPVSVAGVARRTVRRCAVGVYHC